jgi:hypothetical protein
VTERSSPDIADLAEWAEAAAGLFPAHGDKYKQISEILRASLQPASPTAAVKSNLPADSLSLRTATSAMAPASWPPHPML